MNCSLPSLVMLAITSTELPLPTPLSAISAKSWPGTQELAVAGLDTNRLGNVLCVGHHGLRRLLDLLGVETSVDGSLQCSTSADQLVRVGQLGVNAWSVHHSGFWENSSNVGSNLWNVGGASNKQNLVNVQSLQASLGNHRFHETRHSGENRATRHLETQSVDCGVEIVSLGKRVDRNSGCLNVGKSLLGDHTGALQLGQGSGVRGWVHLVFFLELLGEELNKSVVQLVSAQVVIVSSSKNGQNTSSDSNNGGIRTDSSEISNNKQLVLVQSVLGDKMRQKSSSWLVDQLQNVDTGFSSNLLQVGLLRIGEVGRNGDHSTLNFLSNVVLSSSLDLLQVSSGDLINRDRLVIDGVANLSVDLDRMSRVLRVSWVDLVETQTNEVSKVDHSGVWVSNKLSLGLGTVVLVVSHVRKRRGDEPVTVRVGNDVNLAVVGNSNRRGGVTKCNSNRSHSAITDHGRETRVWERARAVQERGISRQSECAIRARRGSRLVSAGWSGSWSTHRHIACGWHREAQVSRVVYLCWLHIVTFCQCRKSRKRRQRRTVHSQTSQNGTESGRELVQERHRRSDRHTSGSRHGGRSSSRGGCGVCFRGRGELCGCIRFCSIFGGRGGGCFCVRLCICLCVVIRDRLLGNSLGGGFDVQLRLRHRLHIQTRLRSHVVLRVGDVLVVRGGELFPFVLGQELVDGRGSQRDFVNGRGVCVGLCCSSSSPLNLPTLSLMASRIPWSVTSALEAATDWFTAAGWIFFSGAEVFATLTDLVVSSLAIFFGLTADDLASLDDVFLLSLVTFFFACVFLASFSSVSNLNLNGLPLFVKCELTST
ncbi:hypothetical protein OGAPHI_006302 [Ogataea philodendri]|uniref:Uncharacterized protein n=1 Tax=Ogataea philodendri TaxID=1378263 RepID=A0A9P8T1W4_9ASCO|nr:uncharacterized protein OGAPHI_006302 [Ogataea philodendri]KAH3662121.1 hypothetical protein OGAPHI_006302 [Ogataea philodendri]